MGNCIFCEIVAAENSGREIVWESKDHIAFLDAYPSKIGHTLLIPKKHVVNIKDMDAAEYTSIFDASREVLHLLKKSMGTDIVTLFVEGLSVAHVHIHLIPMNSDDKLGVFEKLTLTPEELRATGDQIRNCS